jgi:hypothetical protein
MKNAGKCETMLFLTLFFHDKIRTSRRINGIIIRMWKPHIPAFARRFQGFTFKYKSSSPRDYAGTNGTGFESFLFPEAGRPEPVSK